MLFRSLVSHRGRSQRGGAHKVARTGVQGPGHEARHEEVQHRVPPKVLDDEQVESELGGDVERNPARRRLRLDKARTEGVKEDLERPEGGSGVRESGDGCGGVTNAKNAFPKTLLSTSSSSLVGMSVSMPSSARNCKRGRVRFGTTGDDDEVVRPCGARYDTEKD